MEGAELDARATALARSGAYRFLASALRYPDEAAWEVVAGEGGRAEFRASAEVLADTAPFEGLPRATEVLGAFETGSLGELRKEYEATFGHIVSSDCPPYELSYGAGHSFMQSHTLSDISGFYRAFGLEVAEGAPERPDHVGLELEFLYFLSFKEARAREEGAEERVVLCREAQRKFLEDHLGRWGPLFAGRLAAMGPGFYRALGRWMEAFLSRDCRHLGARPRPLTVREMEEWGEEGGGPWCEQSPLAGGEPGAGRFLRG